MADARRALITGATGQDGRLLSRLLRLEGYDVAGTSRTTDDGVSAEGVPLHRCSLRDDAEATALVAALRPHEIYNFAAFSTGSGMFDDPVAMGDVNGLGPVRLLEAIRRVDPSIRFFQASSSEMFGRRSPAPQGPTTPLDPRSPYGTAKQYAHVMVDVYRKHHGLFACSGILFNHESPLRPPAFVTRKVVRAAVMIAAGRADHVVLGDLDARRDWGHARDHVRAAWMMLQAEQPTDQVIATGVTHSIRDLAALAFTAVGLDYRDHVRIDPTFRRPSESVALVGDPSSLRALGWQPEVGFADLIAEMVAAEQHILNDTTVKGTSLDVPKG
ncbi:GDP-mannose 4,6-dehydratase [Sphingomonas sp. CD22]|uniref:GDP-mannose 4,6-dehydratase n=1 Tax=Sphingomonas sp. CD22 TaxID=3100214 RepID=UPI002ADF4BBC|nr:GDP-mannose 4,6-dehydratase [Sphingomonas sp. CD22]MEA1085866.1 GDP-mannose 4,6-dehydratase [Sphingomonas sp. CD22]